MSIWEEAVPELERAGGWKAYYIEGACQRAVASQADEYPVLVDLVEMLVLENEGVGAKTAMHIIAEIGLVLNKLGVDGAHR